MEENWRNDLKSVVPFVIMLVAGGVTIFFMLLITLFTLEPVFLFLIPGGVFLLIFGIIKIVSVSSYNAAIIRQNTQTTDSTNEYVAQEVQNVEVAPVVQDAQMSDEQKREQLVVQTKVGAV